MKSISVAPRAPPFAKRGRDGVGRRTPPLGGLPSLRVCLTALLLAAAAAVPVGTFVTPAVAVGAQGLPLAALRPALTASVSNVPTGKVLRRMSSLWHLQMMTTAGSVREGGMPEAMGSSKAWVESRAAFGLVGPASQTERQVLYEAGYSDGADIGDLAQMEQHSGLRHTLSDRIATAWAAVDLDSTDTWDGFCGLRRKRARRPRFKGAAAVAAEHDDFVPCSSGMLPFSPETHRAGLAWGAGLERRVSSNLQYDSLLSSAVEHPAALNQQQQVCARRGIEQKRAGAVSVDPHLWRSGVGKDEVRPDQPSTPKPADTKQRRGSRVLDGDVWDVSVDPLAWRNGVVKGEVRLLSDMQLLDFEGGLNSFPLGGNRQRFDLSSLKERWNEGGMIHKEKRTQEAHTIPSDTLDTAWTTQPHATPEEGGIARVSPLASLKRKYDEPFGERDERASNCPHPHVE